MLKDGQVAMFGPTKDVLAALTKQQQTGTPGHQQLQAAPAPEKKSGKFNQEINNGKQ